MKNSDLLKYFKTVKKVNINEVKRLLSEGANVHFIDTHNGMSPIHYAASIPDRVDIMEVLLENGAYVNEQVSTHCSTYHPLPTWTPLHFVCKTRDISLIHKLIESGADANIQDNNGNTPLHIACKLLMRTEIIATLVQQGKTNINIKNKDGETPLDIIKKEQKKLLEKVASSEKPDAPKWKDWKCEKTEAIIKRSAESISFLENPIFFKNVYNLDADVSFAI